MAQNNYTAAFLFRDDKVLLVEKKKKPAWQEGLYNAIGGKVNTFETFVACVCREFKEETGRDVSFNQPFATEQGTDYLCHFYKSFLASRDPWVPPPTNDIGERLLWVPVENARFHKMVGNLHWLIPLALDPRRLTRVNVYSPFDNISERPTW